MAHKNDTDVYLRQMILEGENCLDGLPLEALLTAGEISRALQVTVDHVYRLAKTGKLPCIRLGRMLRFNADDVRRYIKECRHADRTH